MRRRSWANRREDEWRENCGETSQGALNIRWRSEVAESIFFARFRTQNWNLPRTTPTASSMIPVPLHVNLTLRNNDNGHIVQPMVWNIEAKPYYFVSECCGRSQLRICEYDWYSLTIRSLSTKLPQLVVEQQQLHDGRWRLTWKTKMEIRNLPHSRPLKYHRNWSNLTNAVVSN